MARHREVKKKCNYQEKSREEKVFGIEKGAPNSALGSRNRIQGQRGIRGKRRDTSSALPHHLPQSEQSRREGAVKGIAQ